LSFSTKIWNIIAKNRLPASGQNGVLGRYDRNKKLIHGNLLETGIEVTM
jgi:hypothetical protein